MSLFNRLLALFHSKPGNVDLPPPPSKVAPSEGEGRRSSYHVSSDGKISTPEDVEKEKEELKIFLENS